MRTLGALFFQEYYPFKALRARFDKQTADDNDGSEASVCRLLPKTLQEKIETTCTQINLNYTASDLYRYIRRPPMDAVRSHSSDSSTHAYSALFGVAAVDFGDLDSKGRLTTAALSSSHVRNLCPPGR